MHFGSDQLPVVMVSIGPEPDNSERGSAARGLIASALVPGLGANGFAERGGDGVISVAGFNLRPAGFSTLGLGLRRDGEWGAVSAARYARMVATATANHGGTASMRRQPAIAR